MRYSGFIMFAPVCTLCKINAPCIAGTLMSSSLCADGTDQADLRPATADSKPQRAGPTHKGQTEDSPPQLPDVAELLNTMRKRLEALNGSSFPRI